MGTFIFAGTALVLTLLTASPLVAADRPQKIFELKSDKEAESFKLVKDESRFAVRSGSKLWVYDAMTGAALWKTEVRNGIDDGLHLVWNDSLYIMQMKKGLTAFDITSGKQVWTIDLEFKMKKYVDHCRVRDLLVLRSRDKVVVLRPDEGKVLWTADFDFFEDAKNLYVIDEAWGSRLVLLGEKGPALFDLQTGAVLWNVKRDLSDEIPDPVLLAGEKSEAAVILYDEGASGLNLKSGEETWFINDAFEDVRGLVRFEQAGGAYCLFGFKKTLVMFDGSTGKLVWKTAAASELKGRPYYTYPSGADVLIITARDTNDGGYVTAFKVKLDSGEVTAKTDLVMSTKNHVQRFVKGIGRVRVNHAWTWEPLRTPQGLLFQVWGPKTRKIADNGKPGGRDGEGLVMVDPGSGAVIWRAYYKLYDEAADVYDRYFSALHDAGVPSMADKKNWDSPSNADLMRSVAEPQIADNAVYVAGNERVLKIDLANGGVAWQSSELGTVSSILVKDNNVYASLGRSGWTYTVKIITSSNQYGEDVPAATKKNCYLCLDGATGKERWKTETAKHGYEVFPAVAAKDGSARYLTDGRYLRQVAFSPAVKGFGWELDMKKKGLGIIGAYDGVIFAKPGPLPDPGDQAVKTAASAHQMEHGMWQLQNGDLLLITSEGPSRISTDGVVLWKKSWDWGPMAVSYAPRRIQSDKFLLYRYRGTLACIDLGTGAVRWELATRGDVFIDSKEQTMFIRDGKDISAYQL